MVDIIVARTQVGKLYSFSVIEPPALPVRIKCFSYKHRAKRDTKGSFTIIEM